MTAETLLLALRARGIDSTELRFAVHEAHHALEAKVKGPWETWAIDRAIKRLGPGRAAASEIQARCVEQIICQRLGVKTKTLEEWIGVSVMEAIKFNDPFLSYTDAVKAAKARLASPAAQRDADAVMALAESKPKTRKRAGQFTRADQPKETK